MCGREVRLLGTLQGQERLALFTPLVVTVRVVGRHAADEAVAAGGVELLGVRGAVHVDVLVLVVGEDGLVGRGHLRAVPS